MRKDEGYFTCGWVEAHKVELPYEVEYRERFN